MKLKNYTEHQGHALKFEDIVILNYGLKKEKNNTAPFDAYTKKGEPVSVKYLGSRKENKRPGEIYLADIFRQADPQAEKFFLAIGFWEKEKENLKEFYIVEIFTKDWKKFFNQELVDEMKDIMKKEGRGKRGSAKDKKAWDAKRDEINKKWRESGYTEISPRFKWLGPTEGEPDTYYKTSGHRIQCALKTEDFFNIFIKSGKFNSRKISGDIFKKYSKVKFSSEKRVEEKAEISVATTTTTTVTTTTTTTTTTTKASLSAKKTFTLFELAEQA